MQKYRVSILLPVYKPDPVYLRATLTSILQADYPDFEVIVSDDCSSGSGVAIISDIEDNRVRRLINTSGSHGIFGNLNHAIRHANGDLLQFFCQDDRMYPYMIASQVKALTDFPDAVMVYAQADYIDQNDRIIQRADAWGATGPKFIPQRNALNGLIRHGCFPGSLSTVMIRASVLCELGLFNAQLVYAADFAMWFQVAQRYDMAVNLPAQLQLRQHAKQASRTLGPLKRLLEVAPVYVELIKCHSIPRSDLFIYLYINERVGVPHFYVLLKGLILDRRTRNLSGLKRLMHYPFSLTLIFVLTLIKGVNKVQYFKMDEIRLVDD